MIMLPPGQRALLDLVVLARVHDDLVRSVDGVASMSLRRKSAQRTPARQPVLTWCQSYETAYANSDPSPFHAPATIGSAAFPIASGT
jgi:hypothetical protein